MSMKRSPEEIAVVLAALAKYPEALRMAKQPDGYPPNSLKKSPESVGQRREMIAELLGQIPNQKKLARMLGVSETCVHEVYKRIGVEPERMAS